MNTINQINGNESSDFLLINEGLGKTIFNGFSRQTIAFLKNLEKNNNKKWFESHRTEYETYLLKPLKILVTDLGEWMHCIDPELEVKPSINKTISKIYRDTRFSKDKTPFRTTLWIVFKRPIKDWKDAPAFFFELSPEHYRYGMGMYASSPQTMARFRQKIDKDPENFLKHILFLSKQDHFKLEGEKYKKIFDPDKPEELQDWYQRKNLYLVSDKNNDDRLFSKLLMDDLLKGFGHITPFYYFLWEMIQAD